MMSGYHVKIVLDSVSTAGVRLTTLECRYNRFVLAEMNTHRMFSRNAASSRAIPVEKMLRMVEEDPALPVWWGKNQAGMQAQVELDGREYGLSMVYWLEARDAAVRHARKLLSLGLHKQIVNRILEPWCWVTNIISATEWANFFKLRCHPEAQPEIRLIAEMMQSAMRESTPVRRRWHLPYLHPSEEVDCEADVPTLEGFDMRHVCVARCARVSYLTQDGVRDLANDIELYDRLSTSGHNSPLEHVAEAMRGPQYWSGNFHGWLQYRKTLPGESGAEHRWEADWQQQSHG